MGRATKYRQTYTVSFDTKGPRRIDNLVGAAIRNYCIDGLTPEELKVEAELVCVQDHPKNDIELRMTIPGDAIIADEMNRHDNIGGVNPYQLRNHIHKYLEERAGIPKRTLKIDLEEVPHQPTLGDAA